MTLITRVQFSLLNAAFLVLLIAFFGLAEYLFLSDISGVKVLLLVASALPIGIAFGWIKAKIWRRVSVGTQPYKTPLYRRRFLIDRIACSVCIGLMLMMISWGSMASGTAFNAEALIGAGSFGFLLFLVLVLADDYFTRQLVAKELPLTTNEEWITRYAMHQFRPGSRGAQLR